MKTFAWRWAAALTCLAAAALVGCGKPFAPASYIDKQRFLAVIADPLEAASGDQISFTAVVVNKDGSLYTGPIAWAVVTGAMLRDQGQTNIDPNDVHLQMPGEPAFVWTVPDAAALTTKFGAPEKNGYLATISATAFVNGDVAGEPISAFKLFIVSDKPPAERAINPTIESFDVFSDGKQVAPDPIGAYEAHRGTVVFVAKPEKDLGALTYHWFATWKHFQPTNLGATQKFAPDDDGNYAIYLVLRQSYFFHHDDSTKTRVTGEDWGRVRVQFTGN